MSTSHPRRTAVAIVGIVACAVAAIVVTAVVVVPDGDAAGTGGATSPTTTQAPLPKLAPMLLDLDEVGALLGSTMRMSLEEDGLAPPAGPEYAAQPAGCLSVAANSEARTYADIAWLEARRTEYKSSQALPGAVAQSVVLTASPDVAAKFLTDVGGQWSRCLNVTYRFGTHSVADFVVRDVAVGSTRITATTAQTNDTTGSCLHVMTVKEAYVIEAATCGFPPFDASTLADEIRAKVPG